MAISAALSSGQQGVEPIPGIAFRGIFTVTWDNASLVTGEPLDLRAWFSTIDAVIPCGVSSIDLAGYVPAFTFTPGATHTDANLLCTLARVPALDGDAASAQPLVPADALDVAALGTTQIMVFGKGAL